MKVLVLLLLSLQGHAEGNCRQYKGFRVRENNGVYQLQLCNSTDNCATPINFTSLELYDYCNGTSGTQDLECDNSSACVDHINSFLSNHYETFDQCAETSIPFTTKTFTPTICVNEPTKPHDLAPVAALAALTGVFLVMLGLVVTGWVWTCWTMKKKKKETQFCKNCQAQESEEERFCLNQIDKMTTTKPVVGTTIEQLLHSLEESGQSNNRLSSKDNISHCDIKRVENFYTSSEGSTNSSLQQEQAVNRIEEGESGEMHMYHVLEKPGGDDYEDPDKDLEDNTATEYETPLPLKELGLKHASIHT